MPVLVPVPGVTATVDGRHAHTNGNGAAVLHTPLRAGKNYTVAASRHGCNPAVTKVQGR